MENYVTLHETMYQHVKSLGLDQEVNSAEALQDVFHYIGVREQAKAWVEFMSACKSNPKQAALVRKLSISQCPENRFRVYTVGKQPEWLSSMSLEERESCKMTPEEFLNLAINQD